MEAAVFSALTLLAAAGGFNFSDRTEITRWRLARTVGWRIYFHSIKFAAILFGIVVILLLIAIGLFVWIQSWVGSGCCTLDGRAFFERVERVLCCSYPLHAALLLTFVSSWPASWLVNRRTKPRKLTEIAEASPNELDAFLHQALGRGMTLLCTLKSQKAYIGRLLAAPEPGTGGILIKLLPYISGYRSSADHTLELTTYYSQLIQDTEDLETLALYIPVAELESIRPYDLSVPRDRFQKPTPSSSSPPSQTATTPPPKATPSE